jgi:hypothetical protein
VIASASCAAVGELEPGGRVRVSRADGRGDPDVLPAEGDAWTVGSELADDVGDGLARVVRGAAAVEVAGG